ncbi:MAG: hypothetical protein WC045_01535 [Patescibacteria group bacterium]
MKKLYKEESENIRTLRVNARKIPGFMSETVFENLQNKLLFHIGEYEDQRLKVLDEDPKDRDRFNASKKSLEKKRSDLIATLKQALEKLETKKLF